MELRCRPPSAKLSSVWLPIPSCLVRPSDRTSRTSKCIGCIPCPNTSFPFPFSMFSELGIGVYCFLVATRQFLCPLLLPCHRQTLESVLQSNAVFLFPHRSL